MQGHSEVAVPTTSSCATAWTDHAASHTKNPTNMILLHSDLKRLDSYDFVLSTIPSPSHRHT
eukprot:8939279-Pyramimonas_sp.AAC.1